MKTISSYQKLKNKIEELEKDIHVLTVQEDSFDAMQIKMRYKMNYEFYKTLLFGKPSILIPRNDDNSLPKGKGLWAHMVKTKYIKHETKQKTKSI